MTQSTRILMFTVIASLQLATGCDGDSRDPATESPTDTGGSTSASGGSTFDSSPGLGGAPSPGTTTAPGGTGAAATSSVGGFNSSSSVPGVGGSGPSVLAPVILTAVPMLGGIHLTWSNTQPDCDVIEGERKSSTEDFAVVFSYTNPAANNRHDGPLTAGTLYTYRVRCTKGSVQSDYSNELSATP